MNHPTLSSTPLEYSLFSPSKAAEQQRLAKDWTYIHQFLALKYPAPAKVPKFEENEETLKALLALAAWNQKGDEGWDVLCAVERECLDGFEEESQKSQDTTTKPNLDDSLVTSLLTSLSTHGLSDLTIHSTTSILLSTNPSATNLSTALLSLSTSLTTLTSHLTTTTNLLSSLHTHQLTLSQELQHLTSSTYKPSPSLPQRTAEISRQTKLLKAKIAEYDERLRNTSTAEIPEKLLGDVETANQNAEGLMQRLNETEAKIEEYEGVPPEAREVRRVMQDLRSELESWIRKRDGLFEGLVGGRR